MNDKDIVQLFFERSQQAVTELSQKYGKLCFHIALNILKCNEDAEEWLLFTGGKIGHDYRGLLRVPHPALHSDGIVSADPEHSDPDMTGLGLSKTSFTDR